MANSKRPTGPPDPASLALLREGTPSPLIPHVNRTRYRTHIGAYRQNHYAFPSLADDRHVSGHHDPHPGYVTQTTRPPKKLRRGLRMLYVSAARKTSQQFISSAKIEPRLTVKNRSTAFQLRTPSRCSAGAIRLSMRHRVWSLCAFLTTR
jgi:hypothetical protein